MCENDPCIAAYHFDCGLGCLLLDDEFRVVLSKEKDADSDYINATYIDVSKRECMYAYVCNWCE